jgi:predicted CopG family antitoxin
MDTASEILKNYLRRQDKDLDRLMKYAGRLRIGNVIENLITIML